MKVYFDFRDWWVGYYRGDTHHYVCLLPTLVIRWTRTEPRCDNCGCSLTEFTHQAETLGRCVLTRTEPGQ